MPDPDPKPDPTPDPAPDPKPDPAPDPKPDAKSDDLGPAGKAALDAERTARKAAEKLARDAQKKLDDIEAANLTEAQRLQKEADDGKALAAKATDTLRQANLRLALAATEGLVDPKAAAKLIASVEYDDDHEPTNLKDRVKVLLDEYPLLKGEPPKPKAPRTNAGEGNGDTPKPDLTADELEQAKQANMEPEKYAGLKGVHTLKDYQKLQQQLTPTQ